MKTLIIVNFPEEDDLLIFQQKFAAELERSDVIFIKNPESITDLEKQLESYEGQFDRVVVSTHGGNNDEIPSMCFGEYLFEITHVIKTVNKGNEKTLKKIHLTSCFIGSNFDKIEQEDSSSCYYSELNESLQNDQILFLHGDSYTGDAGLSLDQRLKGIVESENYSISEAVLDSTEAISVVVKKYLNLRQSASLKTFSYQPFVRNYDNYEGYSTSGLRSYLNDVAKRAIDFENDLKILNSNTSKERLEKLSEEDLQRYLSKTFMMEVAKVVDGNLIEMAETLFGVENLNFVDEEGRTALTFALFIGNTEIAKLLLEKEKIGLNLADRGGWTALMYAVNKGYTETAKLLLEKEEIDLNLADRDGWTALMFASGDDAKIFKLLLEKEKINLNLVNKDGRTALMIAANEGYTEIVKLLLEKEKIDLNLANRDGRTALMIAANEGDTEIVKLLLEKEEIDLNLVNKDDRTALMIAANEGYTEIVKLLLEKEKIDLNLVNKDGRTALMIAANEGDTEIVKLLLEKEKIDLNAVGVDGFTALMIAASKGYTETAKILLEKKEIGLNHANRDGWTALMYATSMGNNEIIKILLEKKEIGLNLANRDDWTPLMYAAHRGDTETVKLLLEKEEIDPNLANKKGFTALKLAVDEGNDEVVEYLIKKGADSEIGNVLQFASDKHKDKVTELLSQAIEVKKKQQEDSVFKKWESAFSQQELKEIGSESSNSVFGFKAILDDNKKFSTFEKNNKYK